jgi:hypothetical protein
VTLMRGARAGMNSPQSGPEQFGMGMFVGGFGLGILLIGLLLVGLAGAGFLIAKRTAHGVSPGLGGKTCLAVGTLLPLLGAVAAAMLLVASRAPP